MHRSKKSVLPELGRLMTAHPATVSVILRKPVFHSPDAANDNQHRGLLDSARVARFVMLIKMWLGLAPP